MVGLNLSNQPLIPNTLNQILSTGASLQEISSIINSVTGLGAISGVKAMTVDFQRATRPT